MLARRGRHAPDVLASPWQFRPPAGTRHTAFVRAMQREGVSAVGMTGTYRGTLQVFVTDDFARRVSTTSYFLLGADRSRIPLLFDGPPPAARTGDTVTFQGTSTPDGVVVNTNAGGGSGLTVIRSDAFTPGAKKVAVLLVNFTNDTSQPWTVAQARSIVFASAESPNGYHQENSFNQISLAGKVSAGGDVFGWYTLPVSNTSCNEDTWQADADAAAAAAGVDLSGYDNKIYVFPDTPSCGWAGLGTIGGAPGLTWVNGELDTRVVAHELGHNFGVHHANSYSCVDANNAPVAISAQCTSNEYGDPFDIMGSATRQMSTFHKGQLNLFAPGNLQTVATSSTVTLTSDEQSSGALQSIRIPRDLDANGNPTTYYYLDYRRPYGQYDNFGSTDPVVNGVEIRLGPDYSVVSQPNLIDTTPGTSTFDDAALALNQTFTDPITGIGITTTALSASTATVSITINRPACTRHNPTVSVTPATQTVKPGGTVPYQVRVTNNDSPACGDSTFNLTPALPSGWTQSPNPATVVLSPTFSGSATVMVTPPAGTAGGTYTVGERATNSGATGFTATGNSAARVLSLLTVKSAGDSGSCPGGPNTAGYTLRCAIAQADSLGSYADIAFALPSTATGCASVTINGIGKTVCTIAPGSALPALTATSSTIDGYSQTGATVNTAAGITPSNAAVLIQLSGGGAGAVDGLTITGANDTIDGLSITGFAGNGISASAGGLALTGNFVGVTPTGGAGGNGAAGIYVHNGAIGSIGGITPDAVNAIGNNTGAGIAVGSAATDTSTHVAILHNQIGGNTGLGIDLAPQGTSTCTASGAGPNDNTNCPSILAASPTKIIGQACPSCIVEVFKVGSGDSASGHGQGPTYVGTAVAAAAGTWTIAPASGLLTAGSVVTATATTSTTPGPSETSEFGQNATVFGGGSIVVTATADLASCPNGPGGSGYSLRCAIAQASADGSGDSISFGIPPSDPGCAPATISGSAVTVCTISPTSPLPTLTSTGTTIDGTTQAGAVQNSATTGSNAILTVRLDGTNAGPTTNGVTITGTNDTVKGLSITGFGTAATSGAYAGINCTTGAGLKVLGSFLGVTPGGVAAGNANGIITCDGATQESIGGTTAAARNVISANSGGSGLSSSGMGVFAYGKTAVQGNLIGTAPDGATAMGNQSVGVWVGGQNTTVGGTTSGSSNVIGANNWGVMLWYAVGAQITGNQIGTTANGGAVGNVIAGVVALGGDTSDTVKGNAVANGHGGILVGNNIGCWGSGSSALHVAISQNATYGNDGSGCEPDGLGIDLAPGGTVNCATTPPGPNDYTPCPTIGTATTARATGSACGNCTVELFLAANDADDQSHGEGRTYLATTTASTSGAWTAALPTGAVTAGQYLTATSTTPASPGPVETSEFGANVQVTGGTSTPTLTLGTATGGAATPQTLGLSGFAANETVQVHWNSVTGTQLAGGTVDGTGALSGLAWTVPATATVGSYSVVAKGVSSGYTASAPFEVNEALNPSTGGHGTNTVVTATGFNAGEPVTILWNCPISSCSASTTFAATADAGGRVTKTVAVPASATIGTYAIGVKGTGSGRFTFANYTVAPTITFTPTSGYHGQLVTLKGYNFAVSAAVTVKWDCSSSTCASPTTVQIAHPTADAGGNFTVTGVQIPVSAVKGAHTVFAKEDTSSTSAKATFTVKTMIVVTPAAGPAGTPLTIAGYGYTGGSTVTVKWNCATASCTSTTVLGTAASNANGDWTLSGTGVSIQPAVPGTYSIGAKANTGTVFAAAKIKETPVLTVTPTSGLKGSTVTLSGTGWKPGETVTLRWDCKLVTCATAPLTTVPAAITADPSGNFSGVTATVPTTTSTAAHTVGGRGSSGAASFATVMYTVTG